MQQQNFTVSSTICNTTDTLIARIPEMKYGIADLNGVEIPVCNISEYHRNTDDIKGEFSNAKFANDFLDKMSYIVSSMVSMYNIPYNGLIFVNQDGDLLINSQLDMVVVAYYFPEVMTEAIDYLRDIYIHLFTIDERLLSQLCARNVPDEIIQQIARTRNIEL